LINLSKEYEIESNIKEFTWFDITEGNELPITLTGMNGIFFCYRTPY